MGEAGGYYIPSIAQNENQLTFAFAPSRDNMETVDNVSIEIPTGAGEYVITGHYELISEDPETYQAQLDNGYDYEAITTAIEEEKNVRCVLSDKNSNRQIFLSLESYEKGEEYVSFTCIDEEHYIWTLISSLEEIALNGAAVLKASTSGGYYIPSI